MEEVELLEKEAPQAVLEDPDEESLEALSIAEERAKQRLAHRPVLDAFEDAVIENPDGTLHFVPDVGSYVTIDRHSVLLPGNPWLDTLTYKVKDVNQVTGDLKLYDEFRHCHARSNFITGTKHGFAFKIPGKKHQFSKIKSARRQHKSFLKPEKEVTKKTPTRRLYESPDGTPCCLLKGKAYGPPSGKNTQATMTDRLEVKAEGSNLIVKHPENNWEERWYLLTNNDK